MVVDTHHIMAMGVIDWSEAAINWHQYNNWPGSGTPTTANGGIQHIFANAGITRGGGNAENLAEGFLDDPDPQGTECPS